MNAIVYTSNTGTTAQYAELIGQKTGLPVYSMEEAGGKLDKGTEIVYLGWLMAGSVKGYSKAAKQYRICAVCAVGMGGTGTQIDEVRKKNNVPESTPVFTLQGGFDLNKLTGVYKMMMNVMKKTAGKALAEKPDRTEEEDRMLELLQHGGNYVSVENLDAFLQWYANR